MSSEPLAPSRPPEPADLVASAALGVEGVHALASGGVGAVATYLPGRRVAGVALRETDAGPRVEVHLVIAYGAVVEQVAARVRGVVAAVLVAEAGQPDAVIDVHVVDVATPPWLEERPATPVSDHL